MKLNSTLPEDLELLILFTLDNAQTGLKIHHEAAPERIASAQRLYEKGLITQPDGGYLTSSGIQLAEHAQVLVGVLN